MATSKAKKTTKKRPTKGKDLAPVAAVLQVQYLRDMNNIIDDTQIRNELFARFAVFSDSIRERFPDLILKTSFQGMILGEESIDL